ncbi:hypothetical protein [Saccharopolyspora sp. NPDC050642]|uniref:hypothetical protein n=1 Tax=Saccharopolyspora sp. NPDC050642 TaxID=3157099 RepID=UPI003400D5CD
MQLADGTTVENPTEHEKIPARTRLGMDGTPRTPAAEIAGRYVEAVESDAQGRRPT